MAQSSHNNFDLPMALPINHWNISIHSIIILSTCIIKQVKKICALHYTAINIHTITNCLSTIFQDIYWNNIYIVILFVSKNCKLVFNGDFHYFTRNCIFSVCGSIYATNFHGNYDFNKFLFKITYELQNFQQMQRYICR